MSSKRTVMRNALHVVRKAAGDGSHAERLARSLRNQAKYRLGKPIVRRDLFAMKGDSGRFGVFGVGGCDVPAIVGAGQSLAPHIDGSLCISWFGKADHTRSDLLLQTLDAPAPDQTAEVMERLGLVDAYFSPFLVEPTFTPADQRGIGSFPKSVVVLSISSDVARTVYQHREHGYLVDPGGWWLTTSMEDVLGDPAKTKWFASTFKKTRRLTVEQSMSNFEQLIGEIRDRLDAYVVVMNVLTVDPGSTSLDYKHANSPNRTRRREFGLALCGLAADLQFPILDVDRLAKQSGVSGQVDFVHYTQEQKRAIANEFAQIVLEAGLADR